MLWAGVAIGLAVVLALNTLVESLFDNHYWFAVRRLELRAKVTLDFSVGFLSLACAVFNGLEKLPHHDLSVLHVGFSN